MVDRYAIVDTQLIHTCQRIIGAKNIGPKFREVIVPVFGVGALDDYYSMPDRRELNIDKTCRSSDRRSNSYLKSVLEPSLLLLGSGTRSKIDFAIVLIREVGIVALVKQLTFACRIRRKRIIYLNRILRSYTANGLCGIRFAKVTLTFLCSGNAKRAGCIRRIVADAVVASENKRIALFPVVVLS